MKASSAALLLLAWTAGASSAAENTSPAEGMRLLRQMATAARDLDYTGTFVYKHGGQIETSRLWHVKDATGDYERLETLDGPPREIVRVNEEVTCFYPGQKTAKVDKWISTRRFPAVVSEQLSSIMANYKVRKGALARVAGHDCRIAVLEPRDSLRYGHVFCAELKTGLPLRATTLNERNEQVEMFAFTQIQIGGDISKDLVRPSYDPQAPGWKIDATRVQGMDADTRWTVVSPPAGFKKIFEVKRTIQGKVASQIVFSDGLAAVSIFIEPAVAAARAAQELSHQGAINVFTRSNDGYLVTALGEAPAATVMHFANSVTGARSKQNP
jgi:sigma-E factor negative regulatory protein RseB